jgi:hypothetical protein
VVAVLLLLPVAPATAAPAPPEPAPAPAPPAEAGWRSRLATAPRKLAFWKKDDAPAAAEPATPKSRPPSPQRTTPTPAPEKAAPEKPAPGAEPAAAKPGFLSRLPSLPNPFHRKADAPAPEPAAATPKTAEKPAAKPARPASAKIKPVRTERLGPPTPPAGSKPKPATAAAAAEPAAAKPSFWSRLTSAVVPGKSAEPEAANVKKPAPVPPQLAEVGPTTFVITKDESPFFSFGPHQATPPDAYLSTGTVVTLQEKTWGWAQVQLPDGRTGIIARNAIRPATSADLVPAFVPPSLVAATAPRRSASESYVVPPAALPDLPTGPASPEAAAEAEELSSALLPPFPE